MDQGEREPLLFCAMRTCWAFLPRTCAYGIEIENMKEKSLGTPKDSRVSITSCIELEEKYTYTGRMMETARNATKRL